MRVAIRDGLIYVGRAPIYCRPAQYWVGHPVSAVVFYWASIAILCEAYFALLLASARELQPLLEVAIVTSFVATALLMAWFVCTKSAPALMTGRAELQGLLLSADDC